jgi:hypothetical protein
MLNNSEDDFTLFPTQEWTSDLPFPQTTFADQSYLNTAAFDALQNPQSLAQLTEAEFNQMLAFKQFLAQQSPEHSPAHPSLFSDSGASVPSTISSAIGSPSVQPLTLDWQKMQLFPSIAAQVDAGFPSTGLEFESFPVAEKNCVDPSLIQPFSPQSQYEGAQFGFAHMSSPSPSIISMPSRSASTIRLPRSNSPHMHTQSWKDQQRQQSIDSDHSRQSSQSLASEDSNKGTCPIPTCGRYVKDLKAHKLTHQNERPEKCPIPTCEYYIKGFARRYDKNRHALTHYKGTMVCGFCPGTGSAAEKSFNRADVLKRHLVSVHGVEQTPPNSRKKSPIAAGKKSSVGAREVSGVCSTCNNTFNNPQDFYEHLDECVLHIVKQIDPCETVNEQLLASVADDADVKKSLEKHILPDSEEQADDDDDDDTSDSTYGGQHSKVSGSVKVGDHISRSGAVCKVGGNRKGLTLSKGGIPLVDNGKGDKRKKNYPVSWGTSRDKMKMRKRVLCVFDGPRRLCKDEMMLDNDHEVRVSLPGLGDGRAWVTDLDIHTLARAEGFLNATEEEKGPWMPEQDELEMLMM